jgi:hypothetical protein
MARVMTINPSTPTHRCGVIGAGHGVIYALFAEGRIVLSPRHHIHYFQFPAGLMVPIHDECGERLRGG